MLFTIIILFFSLTEAFGEPADGATLRWKIPQSGSIGYKASFAGVGESGLTKMDFDAVTFPKEGAIPDVIQEKIKVLELSKEYTSFVVLTPWKDSKLKAKIAFGKVKPTDEGKLPLDFTEAIKKLDVMGKIFGEITEGGQSDSFFLDQKQNNLLAFLFELPQAKVKPGDTWKIGANLIDLGMGFNRSEAQRVNTVTLKSLTKNDKNETIALIYYFLGETAAGIYDNPVEGGKTQSKTTVVFIGQGQFNVEQNRWEKFIGRMNFKSNQPMDMEMQQEFTLDFMPSLPEEFLKAE